MPVTLQLSLNYGNNTSSYGVTYDYKSFLSQDLLAWLNLFARVPHARRAEAVAALVTANHAGLIDMTNTFTDPKERESQLAHTRGRAVRADSRPAQPVLRRAVCAHRDGVLVLLVTCANIANLLLARAAGNARDVGFDFLGASTGRLGRQG